MPDQPLFEMAGVEGRTLEELRDAASTCTNCHLYQDATQTVFGKGPQRARLMIVGEQPGDKEDLAGEPFVGPAGRLLDRALVEAGIERQTVYLTNAVKHFKFTPRGKRRIHSTPNAEEIKACRPWLDGEMAAVGPAVVVALGATAAKALLGASFKVTRQRGEVVDRDGMKLTATVHPSSLLRLKDPERTEAIEQFVADLRATAALLD
ncbi:MAG: UdgX family uracil-DNA binding protein [Nitriliruptorales bacterium]|nr:UdgX family uracil-DNA binding protein [Nitriliruptorales bacterium]